MVLPAQAQWVGAVARSLRGAVAAGVARRSRVAVLTVTAALAASGCVSTTASIPENTGDPALPDDPPIVAALAGDVSQDRRDGQAESPATVDSTDAAVEAARIVPVSAPRDGASPMVTDGVVMAFAASPAEAPRIDRARRAAETAEVPAPAQQQPAAQPSPEKADPPIAPKPAASTGSNRSPIAAAGGESTGSMFDRLYSKRRAAARAPTTGNTRLASAAALPGVRSAETLFGLQGDDGDAVPGASVQLASLGGLGRLSPDTLSRQTERVQVACLKPELIRIIKHVEGHYGRPAVVTSGYRSARANRRAGGARNSMHIDCKAADIQVAGVSKWDLAKFLRTVPGRGGVGTYCRTRSVHVDIGPKREWHHPCRRKAKRRSS